MSTNSQYTEDDLKKAIKMAFNGGMQLSDSEGESWDLSKWEAKILSELTPAPSDSLREEQIRTFVDENFAGLKDAIDDEDIFLWYKDLIIESIKEFALPSTPTEIKTAKT